MRGRVIAPPPYTQPVERMGGYPRIWFGDGGSLDLNEWIPDPLVAEYERTWRQHGCRVEWMQSQRGRLDRVLPQTLERQAHNANVRSWAGTRARRRKHQNGEV